MTYAVIVQGAIASTESKKGAKAFKELLESLGAKTKQEATVPEKTNKRRATPAVPPVKGKRDKRIPKPPPRQGKSDQKK